MGAACELALLYLITEADGLVSIFWMQHDDRVYRVDDCVYRVDDCVYRVDDSARFLGV